MKHVPLIVETLDLTGVSSSVGVLPGQAGTPVVLFTPDETGIFRVTGYIVCTATSIPDGSSNMGVLVYCTDEIGAVTQKGFGAPASIGNADSTIAVFRSSGSSIYYAMVYNNTANPTETTHGLFNVHFVVEQVG